MSLHSASEAGLADRTASCTMLISSAACKALPRHEKRVKTYGQTIQISSVRMRLTTRTGQSWVLCSFSAPHLLHTNRDIFVVFASAPSSVAEKYRAPLCGLLFKMDGTGCDEFAHHLITVIFYVVDVVLLVRVQRLWCLDLYDGSLSVQLKNGYMRGQK